MPDRASLVAREGWVVVVGGVFAALVLLGLGSFVTVDTWLALASGRVVASSGPPATDSLMAWTVGRPWIDQQWLGQLVLYGTWRGGGLPLVGVSHAVVLIATFAGLLTGARRRGGSPAAVAAVGLLAIAPVLLNAGNIRTQTFALPLYAAVLWLLAQDSRVPSFRVLWTLPLLVLWANIHGSVLLGAGLVGLAGLLGLVDARRGERGRGRGLTAAALVVLPVGAVLATPYGTSVLTYFSDLSANGEIAEVAPEWMPVVLEPVQLPFFVLAAVGLAGLGRHRQRLSTFEQLVLAGTLVAALGAARNLVWFGMTSLLLLPVLLTISGAQRPASRWAAPFAVTALVAAAVAAVAGVSSVDRRVDDSFPPAAASAVADAAARDPGLELFVHPRYADWLVLERPELAGRIPFDIRFELLSEAELRRFRIFRDRIGDDWRDVADGARLFVWDSSYKPLGDLPSTSTVLADAVGARVLHTSRDVAVVLQAEAPPP